MLFVTLANVICLLVKVVCLRVKVVCLLVKLLMLPCYVTLCSYAAQVAGLNPVLLPVDPTTFLPNFQQLPPSIIQQLKTCRVLLLNYPNNPTAAVADESFWKAALGFCREHQLLLVHDNPYALQVRLLEAGLCLTNHSKPAVSRTSHT
jgi:histidinol-phosphate/aromatic aminotransferase/cobyric acid decarboxylase-like protein